VPNTPPPLLGFNNNVRHRGRVFHIQTEDSGTKNPRIVTHLFADGGRIIRTTRTDYAEHVGRDDLAQVVRKLMKEQHKGMFIALRAGELDELILGSGLSLGPEVVRTPVELALDSSPSAAPVPVPVPETPEPPAPRARSLSNPNLRRMLPSVPPPAAGSIELDVESLDRNPPPLPRAPRIAAAAPNAGRDATPAPASAAERYAPSRPAAIFGDVPPDSASIFGEKVISEKSLDEVILSYLAEDLDGSPPSK
jgi:hypothetical protein